MKLAYSLKVLLIMWAGLGYLIDGAQRHVQVSGGETIRVMMCGAGSGKYVDIELPGGSEQIGEKCCGDCAPVYGISPQHPSMTAIAVNYFPIVHIRHFESISPRSPLWPGAPPNGPPSTHSA